jgi:cell division protein ZapA
MTTARGNGGARSVQLDVRILGREYKVSCKEDEREELLEAVAFVDRQMREIRGGSKTAGVDRVAVMAALNSANELLRERKVASAAASMPASPHAQSTTSPGSVDDTAARRRIQAMQTAIDQTLAGQEKLF